MARTSATASRERCSTSSARCCPANVLGLPAAVVPGGVVDGLPVGVQVMGDRYTDLRCLTIAAEIEAAVGRFTPIDPVTI